MRKLGLILAVLAVLPLSGAWAEEGFYFTPKIGYSYLGAKLRQGNFNVSGGQVVLGAALGYDFNVDHDIPLRAEFEYAWRGQNEKFNETYAGVHETAEVGAQSFFINGYFDFHNSSPVTPYLGAGLGLARVAGEYRSGATPWEAAQTNFAWNVGAGAAWDVNETVALDLGYRYADFGSLSQTVLTIPIDFNVSTHEVLLGLRFKF